MKYIIIEKSLICDDGSTIIRYRADQLRWWGNEYFCGYYGSVEECEREIYSKLRAEKIIKIINV